MEEIGSGEAEVYAAEKTEKVETEKKVGKSSVEELGQLRDDADVSDNAVRGTLDKDQLKGVRENSAVKPNGEDVIKVKETDSCKVTVVTTMEKSHAQTVVLNPPSMVEPSQSLNSLSKPASSAQGSSLVSTTPTQEPKSGSRNVNSLSVSPVLRTPARDGYNWRKYGQKQVKSPKGSRSYYRCTYSDCCAKKIECSNDLGNVIEVVNKGSHSHEPPRKSNLSIRENRNVPYSLEDTSVARDQSISAKDNICESRIIVERKRICSSVSGGLGENETEDEPEPKRRLKKDNLPSSDSGSRPGKKHKFVVHAAGDVGISGDGYRWRKYGQKMVKGNPNPRNYYRCTSAGCPVRKHIETAVENTTAVIITYKGVHNHDMPVPKKRHGPPSSVLVAAAAPTSMRTRPDDQVTATQCIAGRESEQSNEAMDVGGEKVMESARTLLSIGFEIKQC